MSITVEDIPTIILKEWQFSKKTQSFKASLFLAGPPGIGKTWVVRKAAEEIAKSEGKQLIDIDDIDGPENVPENSIVFVSINLAGSLPEDIIGIPRPQESDESTVATLKYYIQKWLAVATKVPTIIFIDDVGNIQNDELRTVLYDLVQFHRTSTVTLKQSLLIMATNTAEDNVDVREFSSALVNRAPVYRVRFDKEAWIQGYLLPKYNNYQYPSDDEKVIVQRIIMALRALPQKISYNPPELGETLDPWPSPRSWDRFIEKLASGSIEAEYFSQEMVAHVGREATNAVLPLLIREYPEPEEVIENPEVLKEYEGVDLVMAAIMTTDYIIASNIDYQRTAEFLKQLFRISREAFMTSWTTIKHQHPQKFKVFKELRKEEDIRNYIRDFKDFS